MSWRIARAALAVVALSSPAVAEVSVTRLTGGSVELYFEPSPAGPWSRVRPEIVAGDILNLQGDGRGDSWPVRASNTVTGRPEIAWSTAGEAGEVHLAFHDGNMWIPARNVSNRQGADFLPSLALDAWGNRFVTWQNTRQGRVTVLYAGVRGDWTAQLSARELTSRQREGRRPSIGVHADGNVYIAYEEQLNGNEDVPYVGVDRIRPRRDTDGQLRCSGENGIDLSRTSTVRTALSDSSMVAETTVNVEAGRLWVTWIDSANRVGWIKLIGDGVFSEPAYRSFDPNFGPASALEAIRTEALL